MPAQETQRIILRPRADSWAGDLVVAALLVLVPLALWAGGWFTPSPILLLALLAGFALILGDLRRRLRERSLVLSRDGLALGVEGEVMPWYALALGERSGKGSAASLPILHHDGALAVLASDHDLDRVERALRDHGLRPRTAEQLRAEATRTAARREAAWKYLQAIEQPLRARDWMHVVLVAMLLGFGAIVLVLTLVVPIWVESSPSSNIGAWMGGLITAIGLAVLVWGDAWIEVSREWVIVRSLIGAHGLRWDAVTGLEEHDDQTSLRSGEAWLVLPGRTFLGGQAAMAVKLAILAGITALDAPVRNARYRFRHHPSTRLPRRTDEPPPPTRPQTPLTPPPT